MWWSNDGPPPPRGPRADLFHIEAPFAHPEVMMVLLRNPELDRQMAEALRIAEAK